MGRYVVGISGASGIVLGYRLIEYLLRSHHEVYYTITSSANVTAHLELSEDRFRLRDYLKNMDPQHLNNLHEYKEKDFTAPFASGSFIHDGMVIIPCSISTVSAIACGLSDTVIKRGADVCIKEKRKLIIVPRETPLSSIHLENLLKLSQNNVTIMSPVMSWYIRPKSIQDMENHLLEKIADHLGIHNELAPRWGDASLIEKF